MKDYELIALMAATIHSSGEHTSMGAVEIALEIYRHIGNFREEIEHESQKHNRT